jgi:hypothetical protein
MNKPYKNEAIAAITGLAGAFVLVSGLMPFINPGFVDVNETGQYSPRLAFLIPTLLSLPLLGVSWHFNKKGQAIRRELKETEPTRIETSREKKLKWILYGFVILLVLFAFLW